MSLKVTCHPPMGAAQLRDFMRYEQANARPEYLPHVHEWGPLIMVKSHVLEMQVEGERADIPVWIPTLGRWRGVASSICI